MSLSYSWYPWHAPPQFPAPRLVFQDGPELAQSFVAADDEEAYPLDVECCQTAVLEDLRCFITFAGPDETVLGLALYCHAWTRHQQRANLPPDFDMVGDYVSAEAFNEGMLCAVTTTTQRSAQWWEPPSFVSSVRRGINAWIPVYINAQHWAAARRYLPSALAQLAVRFRGPSSQCFCENYSPDLEPADVLDVCCSLLTGAVVGFTNGQSSSARPRSSRSEINERSLQMYADVHRLLLQLAKEIPEVQRLARHRLQDFIESPSSRTHKRSPNLGNLIHCLLLATDITWADLAPSLLPEALRRHAARQRSRGWRFDPCSCGDSVQELVSAWDDFALQAGLVTCFCVMFCERIGTRHGCSLQDVERRYDVRWGRLESGTMADIMSSCRKLCSCKSIADVLPMMLPEGFQGGNMDDAAELILWAERYGRRRDVGVIGQLAWPRLQQSQRPFLREWKALRNNRGKSWRKASWSWVERDMTVSQPDYVPQWVPAAGHHTWR
jgi:hypothetical protein